MVDNRIDFDHRVRRLTKKHEAMSRGYYGRVRKDGLIEMKPRRSGIKLPVRALLLIVASIFIFKGFLLASLGSDTYGYRVERLAGGTAVEQAGAWVMKPDPLSVFLAEQIGPVLR
ncbi:hypothetical protein OEZ49_11650 [Ruegeria sp. WL0004]|uniref:Uncharacterized protein n=1 Tax=Ruegeria marisflavi TaxID=2984152 RepID=A0ABT2WRB9_9RHOB|nr:hypothetical protein [Ruegeria sp. WL0004]MCU9838424.1 hypothetical protein [Ruegeria sp. WL0004]